jgi:hypothetical protein
MSEPSKTSRPDDDTTSSSSAELHAERAPRAGSADLSAGVAPGDLRPEKTQSSVAQPTTAQLMMASPPSAQPDAPASEAAAPREPVRCHACDATLEGEPAGFGFLLFVRGERRIVERPPLCERCAHAIGITALSRFIEEEEEG